MPEKPRYKMVKEKVKEVLDQNFIISPPINIISLIKENYGLKLNFAVFQDENICGFLDVSEKTIWVNFNDNYKRQNFTIAHEFGHWLLHKQEIENDPSSYKILFRQPLGASKDSREIEANTFAGNLLVPTDMLKICHSAHFSIEKMAKLFCVSRDVIGYRLSQEKMND